MDRLLDFIGLMFLAIGFLGAFTLLGVMMAALASTPFTSAVGLALGVSIGIFLAGSTIHLHWS